VDESKAFKIQAADCSRGMVQCRMWLAWRTWDECSGVTKAEAG